MKQKNIIQLLVVNPSENAAIETSNLLRNKGLSISPVVISNAALFDKEINKKVYDIVLFSNGIAELDIFSALEKLNSTQKNNSVVVILIANENSKQTLKLLNHGVSAIIAEDAQELIAFTIKKEMTASRALRNERLLRQQLKDSENRCQQLIDSSRDAIAYLHEGMHILSNDPYYKMFGYESRDDIEAMPIMDLVSANDAPKLKEALRYYAELDKLSPDISQRGNSLKVHGVKEDNTEFQINMEFQPASMSGEDCIQIIIRNENINRKAQEKLQKKLATLNTQCQETGLYNRRYFLEAFENTVEAAVNDNKNSYLLFISLDDFLSMKEKLGDIDSDKLIVDIAGLIKDNISGINSLARFEYYRFSGIVNTDDEAQALQVAESIRKAVEDHIANISDKSVTTTCSIGIAKIDSTSNNSQKILTNVRKACALAVEKGGNQIQLHVTDANEMDAQQLKKYWANEVNLAIKQKRMFLVFQPFVSLLGEGSENFEIFIRLRNQKGETILPHEFLSPLEESEHSLHIDRWLIAEAMQTLAERNKSGHNNRIIIKLTKASLSDNKFISWVKHNLERYQLNAESVIFQIKANEAAENLRQTQLLVKQLHQLGCKFSFEHFGKEQNAFALLKHINVDFLKLDAALVKNISTNADKLAELSKVCTFANEANVQTIVPYIEAAGSLSVIWQSGAHFIQGFFLQEASESMDFDFSSFS